MEINSPLQYLDRDVSIYLYETYFPSKKAKKNKKKLNEELFKQVKSYLFRYQIYNIYEQDVMFCIRGSLYKKAPFLSYIDFYNQRKIRKNINNKSTKARERAIRYNAEALLLKKTFLAIL